MSCSGFSNAIYSLLLNCLFVFGFGEKQFDPPMSFCTPLPYFFRIREQTMISVCKRLSSMQKLCSEVQRLKNIRNIPEKFNCTQ